MSEPAPENHHEEDELRRHTPSHHHKSIRTPHSTDGTPIDIRRASVNRFGFLFDDQDVGMFSEQIITNQNTQEYKDELYKTNNKAQYDTRLQKWKDMTHRWNRVSSSLIKKRIRKGIPDPYRAKAWTLVIKSKLSKVAKFKDSADIPYEEIQKEINAEAEYTISLDVPRSFPKHVRFKDKEGEGQQSLKRALKGYAILDPEVGYCQGMSFIMATLLMYFVEEDALWTFWCMMNETYKLRDLFLPGLPKLLQSICVLEKLIEVHLPKLSAHMKSHDMTASIYASSWFMTLYLVGFPFEITLRVFDCFFNEGEKILYRIALGFLTSIESYLLECKSLDALMQCIKGRQKMIQVDHLFEIAFSIRLTRKDIKQYEEEYRATIQQRTAKIGGKRNSDIPEQKD